MKRILAIILSAIMLISLCTCTPGGDPSVDERPTITLKVWGSQNDQALLKELCEAFAQEHPEKIWLFEYGVVGEADAQARYIGM